MTQQTIYKPNDIVKISSGMGGTFDVRLISFNEENEAGRWIGKVHSPLNKDWHNYIVWFPENKIIKES